MQKLKLSLEDLAVESFATSEERDARGTVLGQRGGGDTFDSCDGYCNSAFTNECCSEWGTYCGGTCESTCHQKLCTCTDPEGTCNYTCETCRFGDTCQDTCPTETTCPTSIGYPGC